MDNWGWILAALTIGFFSRQFLAPYFGEKAKNLATKEDVADITRIVEDIRTGNQLLVERTRPKTAEEILRRETLLQSKISAYHEAIDMAYRKFAAGDHVIAGNLDTYKTPEGVSVPREYEINLIYGRLALYGGSRAVLDKYASLFITRTSPGDIGDLIELMREELGLGEATVLGHEYPYIFGLERTRIPKT